jgi:hypothetical protein
MISVNTMQPKSTQNFLFHAMLYLQAPKCDRHSSKLCGGPARGAAGFANTPTINMSASATQNQHRRACESDSAGPSYQHYGTHMPNNLAY